jgi:hypothetical protein
MKRAWILGAAVAASVVSIDARAEPAKATVTLQCDRATEPGRVKCGVEAKSAAGDQIRWGDVEILQMPDFAQPLRGRIGPRDASARDESVWRWTFAAIAKRAGSGAVVARVRLVVCTDGDRCAPQVVETQAVLQVG